MRSAQHIRREIDLRLEIERARSETTDAVSPWGQLASQRNQSRLVSLNVEFADVSPAFEWTFDGLGVYGHGIAMSRLNQIAEPLARMMRHAARDILVLEGSPDVANLRDLAEPLVASSIAGSFGLRLTRTPVIEQLSFDEQTLFDRVVERVLGVFKAAHNDNPEASVLESVRGLRRTTLNGIRDLSSRLGESAAASQIRWRGSEVVTVRTEDARRIVAAIADVEPSQREIQIRAVLEGGDRRSGVFHLIEQTPDGPKDYRGRSEQATAERLSGLTIGTRVDATLLVLSIDSSWLDEPKETYVLREITPTNRDELLQ
jgi:hypothetical protein